MVLGLVVVVVARQVLVWLRLKSIKLLPLEVTIEEAFTLYGKPEETEPHENWSGAIRHTFSVNLFEVSVTEWRGHVHVVAYHFPARIKDQELAEVLRFYGQDQKWQTLTEGYSYQREDGRRNAWCSALPAIGVGTDTFMERRSAENQDPDPPRDPAGGDSTV
jgi:hypothetical protein